MPEKGKGNEGEEGRAGVAVGDVNLQSGHARSHHSHRHSAHSRPADEAANGLLSNLVDEMDHGFEGCDTTVKQHQSGSASCEGLQPAILTLAPLYRLILDPHGQLLRR